MNEFKSGIAVVFISLDDILYALSQICGNVIVQLRVGSIESIISLSNLRRGESACTSLSNTVPTHGPSVRGWAFINNTACVARSISLESLDEISVFLYNGGNSSSIIQICTNLCLLEFFLYCQNEFFLCIFQVRCKIFELFTEVISYLIESSLWDVRVSFKLLNILLVLRLRANKGCCGDKQKKNLIWHI